MDDFYQCHFDQGCQGNYNTKRSMELLAFLQKVVNVYEPHLHHGKNCAILLGFREQKKIFSILLKKHNLGQFLPKCKHNFKAHLQNS